MAKTQYTVTGIPLPNWGDAGSITAYVLSAAAFVIGILTAVHVVVPNGINNDVTTFAPLLGAAVAGVFQLINYIRVTVLHKAAIVAGVKVNAPGAGFPSVSPS